MMYRCCACDRRLTTDECRIEVEMCPDCRAEHEAACHANRAALLARLIKLLMLFQARRYVMWGETADWMGPELPRALWLAEDGK